MPGVDYVRQLLGVGDCSLKSFHEEVLDGSRLLVYCLEYDGPVPTACPKCGAKLHSHGTRTVAVVATPIRGSKVKLRITFPRRRCSECGEVWKPTIPGVDEVHKMTRDAYINIAQRSLDHTFRDVARDYAITHVTAKNVFSEFMRENNARIRFATPAFLGIDEKNLKRFGMVTVITDLEHRTVFDMVEGRKKKTLEEYFAKVPDLDKVLWVSSDMYRPFWTSLMQFLPNATWVIDHFHVVKAANEALDEVRKDIQSRVPKKERLKLKKGLAYTLRRRARSLSPAEAASIRELRENEKYAQLAVAFDLKEDFFDIYDENEGSRENAEAAFDEWVTNIPTDDIFEPFRKLALTVTNHREFIFNWWDCPARISNGYTECANRLINETDMHGRGYSFDVLRARTLFRRQNLRRALEGGGLTLGPRFDAQGPLFVCEPGRPEDRPGADDGTVGGIFIEPLSGVAIDAATGEILEEEDGRLATVQEDAP